MKTLKKIGTFLIMFLIFVTSFSFTALPVVLGILFSWYWLFLYCIHLSAILLIGICCAIAPQEKEDSSYD